MSGSSGRSGFGGGFESPVDNCAALVIDTQLSSPKDEIVSQLSEGLMLDVVVDEQAGRVIVVALYQGQIAGGLASPQVQRLRECIQQGTQYRATILSIRDGQVRVRVKATL